MPATQNFAVRAASIKATLDLSPASLRARDAPERSKRVELRLRVFAAVWPSPGPPSSSMGRSAHHPTRLLRVSFAPVLAAVVAVRRVFLCSSRLPLLCFGHGFRCGGYRTAVLSHHGGTFLDEVIGGGGGCPRDRERGGRGEQGQRLFYCPRYFRLFCRVAIGVSMQAGRRVQRLVKG